MKDIPGYEGRYAVTEDGRVWSYPKEWVQGSTLQCGHRGKWLKLVPGNRYLGVSLHISGAQKFVYVHRLVALMFIPNPNQLPSVNHIDGDKTNNKVTNLEWVTIADNNRHAVRTGLMNFDAIRGEQNHATHLTNTDVCNIRRRRRQGEFLDVLAKEYKVNKSCVSKIVNRYSWRHLPC